MNWASSWAKPKQGGAVVDLVKVDPSTLPDGVPSFDTKHEAKTAWKRNRATRSVRVAETFDSWSKR